MMGIVAKLVIITSLVSSVMTYFQYSDCDQFCRSENWSCTISMTNAQYFPCDCIEFESGCVNLATRVKVCIRQNGPPVGGEDIWGPFSKLHPRPNTTTPRPPGPGPEPTTTKSPGPEPTPMPVPVNPSKFWLHGLIAYSLATSITLLVIAGYVLKRFVSKRQRSVDKPANENRPLIENPFSPYQSTTSPVTSD